MTDKNPLRNIKMTAADIERARQMIEIERRVRFLARCIGMSADVFRQKSFVEVMKDGNTTIGVIL